MATAQMKGVGAPLQGLTGLYGDPMDTVDLMDEGVLESKANAIVSEHSEYGSQSYGYSGTVPSASPFSGQGAYDSGMTMMDGSGLEYPESGASIDNTPDTHRAPYPRGIIQPSWSNPDAWAEVGCQVKELHEPDLGGVEKYTQTNPAGAVNGFNIAVNRYESPDDITLATMNPDQLRGAGGGQGSNGRGNGGADVTQGFGHANSMEEFSHGHSLRYVDHTPMPFDYTNTHGEQDVPFMGRHPIQQMPFDGPDSPYYAAGEIDGANIPWEGRIGYPTQYVTPPEVTTLPPAPQTTDVWAYA